VQPAAPGSWQQIDGAVIPTAIACVAYFGSCSLRLLWARLSARIPKGAMSRALPLLGMSLLVTASASARERRPAIPHRSRLLSHAPPWSEPGGYSPPHPSGRVGVGAFVPDRAHERLPVGKRPVLSSKTSRHTPQTSGKRAPLGSARSDADPQTTGTFVVGAGDSLWSIAGAWLESSDGARIARYWPRIHRANRSTIGRDPNLIRPGQVLAMPVEHDPAPETGS
jgi:hypothetical protein